MRLVKQVAEPQVVGLTPQTTAIRKADTMKTYTLRSAKTVQRQASPAPATLPAARPGRSPTTPNGPALFIGLDVHTDSIAVSLAPSDTTEVRRYGLIGGTHDDVLKLARKLQSAHPDVILKFCYEAGPDRKSTRLNSSHRT